MPAWQITLFTISIQKEYITIYYNSLTKEISISGNKGDFKKMDFDKPKGEGDQTQLLQIINQYEALGFHLEQYNFGSLATTGERSVISVLMVKG